MKRLILIALVALGLAPGTFVRTPVEADPADARMAIRSVMGEDGQSGPLKLTGAWEITSPHDFFGGFSALVAIDDGKTLLAGSDRGWTLTLPLDQSEPQAPGAELRYFAQRRKDRSEVIDLEALTLGGDGKTLWAAYEAANLIERIAPDGTRAFIAPPQMRGWAANSGAESLLALPDGRFLVLAEAPNEQGRRDRPGLLFLRDPLLGEEPLEFRLVTPRKFSPVDAEVLPDGRVLILLRRSELAMPPRFHIALMIADPEEIAAGKQWTGEILTHLTGDLYDENFEGLEFVPDPGDPQSGSLYLIADDNFSVFQRSLLLRFDWSAPLPDKSERDTQKGRDG